MSNAWLKPQEIKLWGIARVEHIYKGRQQRAVLLPEVYPTQRAAWESACLAFGGGPTAMDWKERLLVEGVHVVPVYVRTGNTVPRRISPTRVASKPALVIHG